MPQPSRCGPVRPPRCINPVKLKWISVGTLALMPSNSHIASSGFRSQAGFGSGLVAACRTVTRVVFLGFFEPFTQGPRIFFGCGGFAPTTQLALDWPAQRHHHGVQSEGNQSVERQIGNRTPGIGTDLEQRV